jgi:hypothetical protein
MTEDCKYPVASEWLPDYQLLEEIAGSYEKNAYF